MIEKILERLREKFNYNSEQAEIYREGSDKDAYFREKEELYRDRANTYGVAIQIVQEVAQEYGDGWITDRVPTKEECGGYGREFLTTILQGNGYSTIAMRHEYVTVRGKEVSRWTKHGRISIWKVVAWQPLPAPYQPKNPYNEEECKSHRSVSAFADGNCADHCDMQCPYQPKGE